MAKKAYIGVEGKYIPFTEGTNIRSWMKNDETYYFTTPESITYKESSTGLKFEFSLTTPLLGADAIGYCAVSTYGSTKPTTITESTAYLKITGVSDNGYLIFERHSSKYTSVARKIRKGHIGVDNVARRIKKA